jgi:phenylalanyl-tRNA synthetase alpha chain
MNEQLTEGERIVLSGLSRLGKRTDTGELAAKIKQREERIISILNALAEKGIVKIETREIITYSLTDEGKEYAAQGLPEVRLLKSILDLGGSAKLEDAVAKAGISSQSKGISMNWAIRNDWVTISRKAVLAKTRLMIQS